MGRLSKHPYDGSSIDLEEALIRYMVVNKVSRRQLLEAIAKVGPVAALAPVLAACASAASPSPSPGPSSAGSTAPSTAPSPSPTPEAELNVYNWSEYIGEGVIDDFEAKYGVKVNYTIFPDIDTAYATLGDDGGGFDVSFPISVDVPRLVASGALRPLDHSLLPNIANLGTEWADPGYDPGNAHSVPYMWWTTGIAYDTAQIDEELTSSTALWDPRFDQHLLVLDDWQEVFGMAHIQLGHSANSTDPAEIDAAQALLERLHPLVRKYSNDTTLEMPTLDYWIGQVWSGDIWPIQEAIETMVFYNPEEGGVKGSDTMAIFSGGEHPIAAHLFIDHMLDAEVSAKNTNYIGYMGPNAAAMAFIDDAILEEPAINPSAELIATLEELLDLGQAAREDYQRRFQELRGLG
jgi:spermidine/putrescine transport system substrate-binding protein